MNSPASVAILDAQSRIIAVSDLLLDADLTAPQLQDLDHLKASAEGLLRIVNGILEVSALDAPLPGGTPLAGVRVLVAEDNRVTSLLFQQLLLRAGAEVDIVDDGGRVLELVAIWTYDVVMLDLQMPRLDGYQTARAIRALPPGAARDVPLVAVTASPRYEVGERARQAGFTDFVEKPVRADALIATIRRLARAAIRVRATRG
jgi:CheY-like chemotaxis protein